MIFTEAIMCRRVENIMERYHRKAELALHRAKHRGKNQFVVFQTNLEQMGNR